MRPHPELPQSRCGRDGENRCLCKDLKRGRKALREMGKVDSIEPRKVSSGLPVLQKMEELAEKRRENRGGHSLTSILWPDGVTQYVDV